MKTSKFSLSGLLVGILVGIIFYFIFFLLVIPNWGIFP